MYTKLIFLTVIALIFTRVLFAKDEEKPDEEGNVEEVIDWAWPGIFYPFIEASMGISQLSQEKFEGQMPEESLVELKLGYSQLKEYEKNVWELDERFIYGSYMADDIFTSMNLDSGDFSAKLTRFGFGNRLGYGYRIKSFVLILYQQSGINWTEIRTDQYDSLSTNDISILERYEGTYRFGMNTEGGIRLEFLKSLSFTASYEVAVVYPRVVFWPWLGSNIILSAGLGIVSSFTDDIIRSSPVAGPIFYFLLRNGIAFAYYKGVSNKMNWPFNSETPMMIDTFKFGLSYTF